jgi:hypothetical protein
MARPSSPWVIGAWAGLVALDLFIAFAGFQMIEMRSSRLVAAAAILCCIPGLSPLLFVGIPFGIWTLRLLRQSDTIQAFDEEVQRRRMKGDA